MTRLRRTSRIIGLVGFYLALGYARLAAGTVDLSWDANTESDLKGYKIYYGAANRDYNKVLDVGNVTAFTVRELEAGRTYYFAVTAYDLVGNESTWSQEVSATISGDNGGGNTDSTPPALVAVVPKGETQIDVIFSEAVEEASAENSANYAITNGPQIIGAVLDSDAAIVHLITSTHARGQSYELSITNVQDLNGNGLASGTTKSYDIPDPSQDASAPELIYAVAKDNAVVEIIFNEHVNSQQATDVRNYTISNGVEVTAAEVTENRSIVKLTTTEHRPSTAYTLTVANVEDLAGNLIGDKNSFAYQTAAPEGNADTSSPNLVSVIVRGETQLDVNFNEPITRRPAENLGNYAIDNGVQVKGAVMSENRTTVHLVTSSHTNNVAYALTVRNIEDVAGNKVAENNRASYTYRANGDFRPENGTLTPTSFSLFQNYPNPFNPETEIRFYLDADQKMELKVYNQLGQVIRTLVQREMPPGIHSIVWDGRNDDGNEVPTGVYIYSLEVTRNVLKGNLLVNVALERRVKRMTLIR